MPSLPDSHSLAHNGAANGSTHDDCALNGSSPEDLGHDGPDAPDTETLSRADASRSNGAKSQGPVTDEGKARSSGNSRRHGVFVCGALDEADEEFLAEIRADLTDRHAPATAVERHLVDALAMSLLQQRRLWDLEARVHDAALSNGRSPQRLPTFGTLCRYKARIERDWRQAFDLLKELARQRTTQTQTMSPDAMLDAYLGYAPSDTAPFAAAQDPFFDGSDADVSEAPAGVHLADTYAYDEGVTDEPEPCAEGVPHPDFVGADMASETAHAASRVPAPTQYPGRIPAAPGLATDNPVAAAAIVEALMAQARAQMATAML